MKSGLLQLFKDCALQIPKIKRFQLGTFDEETMVDMKQGSRLSEQTNNHLMKKDPLSLVLRIGCLKAEKMRH